MYYYHVKYQLSTGPICTSSHDFFLSDRHLASIYYCSGYLLYTEAYLTWATNCSQGANLELLLSSHHFTCTTTMYHYLVKYQLSTGSIYPSSHDMPFSCPSPLSNQALPHNHQHSQQAMLYIQRLHVTLHCALHDMDVTWMLHQCYTNITPGLHKPIPGYVMCLEPDWVREPGTSLPNVWGIT